MSAQKPTPDLFLALLSGTILAASFVVGLHRGMHRIVPGAVGRHTLSMAVAISDFRYGQKGYVAYKNVIDALTPITNDPVLLRRQGLTREQSLKDPRHINATLRAAAALDSPAGNGYDPLLREDKGLAVYFKLAFGLFGYRVQGFYFLYFLLLGVSAAVYTAGFHRRTDRMLILFLFSLSHLFLLNAPALDHLELGTVYNPRFLPVLAVLPALHLVFYALGRNSPAPTRVASAVIQTSILCLAVHARSSAFAMVMFLFAACALAVISHWRRFPALGRYALNRIRLWPLVIAACGVLALKAHVLIAQNPYHSAAPQSHLLWHAFYLGLSAHPQSLDRYGISYDSDEVGFSAGRRLALEKRGIELGEEMDYTLYESVIKDEYLRIARADPFFFVSNYSFKTALFFRRYFGRAYAGGELPLCAALFFGAFAAGWLLPFTRPAFPRLAAVLFLCLAFSMLPTMIAMPEAHLIACPVLVLTMLICAALAAGAAGLRSVRRTGG